MNWKRPCKPIRSYCKPSRKAGRAISCALPFEDRAPQQAVAVCREAIRFNRNELFSDRQHCLGLHLLWIGCRCTSSLRRGASTKPTRRMSSPTPVHASFCARRPIRYAGVFRIWRRASPESTTACSPEAYTETYHGRLGKARRLWQQAVASVNLAELRKQSPGGKPVKPFWRRKSATGPGSTIGSRGPGSQGRVATWK